jgi:flagellar motility protein MotE (MotC chaperone)
MMAWSLSFESGLKTMRAGIRNLHIFIHNTYYAIKPWIGKAAVMAPLGALTVGFSPAPASAQQNRAEPIRAAIAEVRAEEAKGRPLLQRMQQLAAQNEAKKKDYDATDAQLKALQPRLDRYNANLTKYDGQLTDYSKRVDAYNGKCGGLTPLPQDQYRACLAEKGELAGRKIELDAAKGTLETERQAIEAEIKGKTERLTVISREMTANLRSWETTQKDYKAIFDRIEAVKKRLIDMCTAGDQAKDPFAVRLCVGAGWDGQKKEFAGLTDLPSPAQ